MRGAAAAAREVGPGVRLAREAIRLAGRMGGRARLVERSRRRGQRRARRGFGSDTRRRFRKAPAAPQPCRARIRDAACRPPWSPPSPKPLQRTRTIRSLAPAASAPAQNPAEDTRQHVRTPVISSYCLAPPQTWEPGPLRPIVPGASPKLTAGCARAPDPRVFPSNVPRPGMQPAARAAIREVAGRDVLAADLRCSLFASALQSYKRDSVLRPFPASYAHHDCKDFEALLADASKLPNLKELLQSSGDKDKRSWDLVSWILSSKVLTIHSTGKSEFEKIQKLTGAPHTPVPVPDFLFEIQYSDPANAKFYETKGERDLIYAFHGSRLENFHSIIHNGLHCHLNKTSLFGEGTYLTSDLSLALIYSPHGLGWQRSLLGPILSCVAVCEVIDHPDVKCQTKKKDSKEIDRRRARIKHSEGGDIPPKYFVVTNNQLLRVKYLLVYSQKQPKRASSQLSWFSSHWFTVMISFYLLLLLIVSVINSSAFQHFWNRAKR
ncbi:Protein mono-ADP-ribosyltransferase PARP16 [Galemys pyrenaicus]|uniref:Poly [ADP-ribose] polymerase n=1 Tax=Galemys pyrenaicus TaxID=202257 RepID=A0A8J6AF81_GALPY|nr:Protein mono-ADP-ribosyltransferase PARP16 [Galemys pyrenaicus]